MTQTNEPFYCYCDFKKEWDRKGSDEFWTHYGCPPEEYPVHKLQWYSCCNKYERERLLKK